ncbi:hypothetical protein [Clostridium sp.]|uniref:hypothetical protein n=1 Tax=Clostridium sp. TaxID=1506 RepID=UPI00359F7B7E
MKELGIKAQYVRPYTVTTKDSNFSSGLNILDEKFNPAIPNTVWCTDITYLWTDEGFGIPYKYHGLVLSKNHCLDAFRKLRSFLCY